jgi:hypothetical protein
MNRGQLGKPFRQRLAGCPDYARSSRICGKPPTSSRAKRRWRKAQLAAPQVRGPHGQAFVRGVEVPCQEAHSKNSL